MRSAERTSDALGSIVGESPEMRRLKAYLPKLAQSDSTALVIGETGTGKEVVAEALHNLSPRRDRPLVYVNCAAIPEGLVESELFGYERGAFTGAVARTEGLLRRAQGGTVVLDEIGDMGPLGQAKLLRVLESRQIHRLGAHRSDHVDVRFVASTNHDLEALVARNRFRRDLFYRLSVARLVLPTLRARKEDIPLLVEHFLGTEEHRRQRRLPRPDSAAIESLVKYHWPGNVRELRNVFEEICIDPPSIITPTHLPPHIRRAAIDNPELTLTERERLMSVLLATNWNKTQAAAQLHWSRMTLYRKLHKHDIALVKAGPYTTPDDDSSS